MPNLDLRRQPVFPPGLPHGKYSKDLIALAYPSFG
jgi:hypothetical protein